MGSSLVPLKSALLMTRRKKGSSFPCCLASNSYFSGPTAWSIVSIIFSSFFNAALVERALVAVRVTVAAAHLATELPTMSDAIMNLRSIPNKLGGVVALFLSVAIFYLMPSIKS